MKKTDVIKSLSKDFNTSNVDEINTQLKAKNYKPIKYRITGEALGHYGYTGVIKAIAAEGLKVFTASKVSLIRFADMKTFDKAKPREERPVKKAASATESAEMAPAAKGKTAKAAAATAKPVAGKASAKSAPTAKAAAPAKSTATKSPAKVIAKKATPKSAKKVKEEHGPVEGEAHSKFIHPDDGYGEFTPTRAQRTGSKFIPKPRK